MRKLIVIYYLNSGQIYIPGANAKGKRSRYVQINSLAEGVLEELKMLKVKGLRKRKFIRGNTLSEEIAQVNVKIVSGEGDIEMMLGIKKEEKPEEAKPEEKKEESK